MMDPNNHFNDALVKAHQARLKDLWNNGASGHLPQDDDSRSRIRTAMGNLLIRWGERVGGYEHQAAAHAPRGRFVAS